MLSFLPRYFNVALLSAGGTGGDINKTGYIILIIVLFFGGTIVAGLTTFFIVRHNIKRKEKNKLFTSHNANTNIFKKNM